MRTVESIIEDARSITKIDGATVSTPGLQDSMMISVVDKANREWIRAFRKNGIYVSGTTAEEAYDLIASTNLNGAVSDGDTSITVDDSSGFPASGALVIYDDNPDIIAYTGNTANVFSGVTGVHFDHDDNDVVEALYALPADFLQVRQGESNRYGLLVDNVEFRYTPDRPLASEFTIRNGYLWLGEGTTGTAYLTYISEIATIDELTDTVIMGEDYDNFIVYRAAQHISKIRGLDNKYTEHKAEADEILQAGVRENRVIDHVRVRPINARKKLYYRS